MAVDSTARDVMLAKLLGVSKASLSKKSTVKLSEKQSSVYYQE